MIRVLTLAMIILVASTDLHAESARNCQSNCPGAKTAATSSIELRVGVRSTARPFSYKDTEYAGSKNRSTKSGPLRAEGYDGYMVYICDEVFKQMLINEQHTPDLNVNQIKPVDVDKIMSEQGQSAQFKDRLHLLGSGKIDILCDPATITRDRVKYYAVSPPLFVTGIGYLTLQGTLPPRLNVCQDGKALIGVVGSTNAFSGGIQAILDAGEWARKEYSQAITEALRRGGATADCTRNSDGEPSGIIWAGKTHKNVARAFCNEKINYYVGDIEIISNNASSNPGCIWRGGLKSFTNDRYAIFANIDYEADPVRARWIGRFFEVLNREIATTDSLLDRAYTATFGSAPKSRKLELFYWSLRGMP